MSHPYTAPMSHQPSCLLPIPTYRHMHTNIPISTYQHRYLTPDAGAGSLSAKEGILLLQRFATFERVGGAESLPDGAWDSLFLDMLYTLCTQDIEFQVWWCGVGEWVCGGLGVWRIGCVADWVCGMVYVSRNIYIYVLMCTCTHSLSFLTFIPPRFTHLPALHPSLPVSHTPPLSFHTHRASLSKQMPFVPLNAASCWVCDPATQPLVPNFSNCYRRAYPEICIVG